MGDWVGVGGIDAAGADFMRVREMGVFMTVFENLSNRYIQVPNHVLINCTIENHSRSHNATFIMIFEVGLSTTTEQFNELSARVLAFMKSRPLEWRSDLCVYCNTGNYRTGVMEVEFWATHQLPWSAIDPIWSSQSELVLMILDIMAALDMTYRQPTLPLAFNTRLHSVTRVVSAAQSVQPGAPAGPVRRMRL